MNATELKLRYIPEWYARMKKISRLRKAWKCHEELDYIIKAYNDMECKYRTCIVGEAWGWNPEYATIALHNRERGCEDCTDYADELGWLYQYDIKRFQQELDAFLKHFHKEHGVMKKK